jgi:Undecaprenyl-phosphate galactose phosphotransferase WbaP
MGPHLKRVTDERLLDTDAGHEPAPLSLSQSRIDRPASVRQAGFVRIDTPAPENELSTMELVSMEEADLQYSVQRFCKRTIDVVGAVVLAVVFAPLIVAILFVMHRQGGVPIFRHKRVGRNGELFECLKFRTMVPNAELVLRELLTSNPSLREEWDRDHKLRDDPRVTRLGRFLRSTSLDELPQILNVLRGEMSLVGPRPVTREELLRYGRNMLLYMMVKPGITGLWQVSGRSNTDYRRRVAIDVCYVRNQSALLDLWILLKTTRVVLGRHGAY